VSRRAWILFETFSCLAIGAAAFVFCWECGRRGFFPLDQSIVYDGAWRVALGQRPFRDFVAPIGPMSFFYQAFLFTLFGPGFRAYLIGGALLNAMASMMVFALLRTVASTKGIGRVSGYSAAMGAACVTAVWFQAQMGTTYPDQVAMFLCLASLLLAMLGTGSDNVSENKRKWLFAAAGLAWGLAFASKQNYAAFFAPVLALALFVETGKKRWWRAAAWTALGTAVFALSSLIWLLAVSDIRLFVKYFFAIPISEGLRRLSGGGSTGAARFHVLWSVAIPLSAVCAATSWKLVGIWNDNDGLRQRFLKEADTALLTLALAVYGTAMAVTTNNNPENAWSLLGLTLGFGFVTIFGRSRTETPDSLGHTDADGERRGEPTPPSKRRSVVAVAAVCAVSAAAVCAGTVSAWERRAQDLLPPLSFHALGFPPSISSLLWCDRTPVGAVDGQWVVLPGRDVKTVCRIMASYQGNVFVFSDFTALYGFTGKIPPQPLLWFHDGLTYPRGGDPELDEWIVSELEKNKVGMIVFEEVSWFGTYITLGKFPKLRRYLDDKFRVAARLGIYQIKLRKKQ